jgi:NAD(P)-dependent dehydrogenase (short-subunit alcohol dehydrogenase family)
MARNQERLVAFVQQAAFDASRVLIYAGDVRSETDCKAAIEAAIARFGKLDVVISNAGISMRSAFLETQPDVLHQVMDTNFWGMVHITRYALPHLLASEGSLIGISSITGIKGLPGRTAYAASKFAMQGFLESLRMEYAAYPVHIGIVAPDLPVLQFARRHSQQAEAFRKILHATSRA